VTVLAFDQPDPTLAELAPYYFKDVVDKLDMATFAQVTGYPLETVENWRRADKHFRAEQPAGRGGEWYVEKWEALRFITQRGIRAYWSRAVPTEKLPRKAG
jgi:hypothetical protein